MQQKTLTFGQYSVRVDGKTINDQTLSEVLGFFFMYIMVFRGATLIITIEGKDLITTITSVATTIGNVGPRLGIYPILLLIFPSFWRK
jgi:trk system potassium uptake protein TrkH